MCSSSVVSAARFMWFPSTLCAAAHIEWTVKITLGDPLAQAVSHNTSCNSPSTVIRIPPPLFLHVSCGIPLIWHSSTCLQHQLNMPATPVQHACNTSSTHPLLPHAMQGMQIDIRLPHSAPTTATLHAFSTGSAVQAICLTTPPTHTNATYAQLCPWLQDKVTQKANCCLLCWPEREDLNQRTKTWQF
jgi:hypothetical protein